MNYDIFLTTVQGGERRIVREIGQEWIDAGVSRESLSKVAELASEGDRLMINDEKYKVATRAFIVKKDISIRLFVYLL